MAQKHPTQGVAAAKLPRERLAQLDRLAQKRGLTRSMLMREAIEAKLAEGDEPLTEAEARELERRQRNTEAMRRLGEIRRSLRLPLAQRLAADDLRRSMRLR